MESGDQAVASTLIATESERIKGFGSFQNPTEDRGIECSHKLGSFLGFKMLLKSKELCILTVQMRY